MSRLLEKRIAELQAENELLLRDVIVLGAHVDVLRAMLPEYPATTKVLAMIEKVAA